MESKKKVCPFIEDAYYSMGNRAVNLNTPKNIYCITTGCMAWAQGSRPDNGFCKRLQTC